MSEDSIQADSSGAVPSPYQFGVWYPIESALKENTEGDVWVECPDFQGHRVADCVFQGGEWWRGLTPINAVRRGDTFLIKATHWMPLPSPPSQGDRPNEDVEIVHCVNTYDEVVGALEDLIYHIEALRGADAHRVGCQCGGTNDGKHSCASFLISNERARAALAKAKGE